MLAYFDSSLGWGELLRRTLRETKADHGLGQLGVSLSNPPLRLGSHPTDLTVQYQPEHGVAGDELDGPSGQIGQALSRAAGDGCGPDQLLDHPGQLGLDQGGDQIVPIDEVVIEGGPAHSGGKGYLAERDLGGAGLGDEGLGRGEQRGPDQGLVLVDGRGADPGHP